jgi:DNA topoisomerase III
MEYAGRAIEDETLRAAMKDTGLGTPATRAATIETLVRRDFIARQGKQIVPTATGIALVEGLPVASLASPELTGAWEARLARIARGKDTREAFMSDIARYVEDIVDAIRRGPGPPRAPAPPSRPRPAAPTSSVRAAGARISAAAAATTAVTAPREGTTRDVTLTCPRCKQGPLLAGKRGWGCSRWRQGCSFVVWFETAGRQLSPAQLRDLVAKGKTRKATWNPDGGAAPTPGRLILDLEAPAPSGGARFEPS